MTFSSPPPPLQGANLPPPGEKKACESPVLLCRYLLQVPVREESGERIEPWGPHMLAMPITPAPATARTPTPTPIAFQAAAQGGGLRGEGSLATWMQHQPHLPHQPQHQASRAPCSCDTPVFPSSSLTPLVKQEAWEFRSLDWDLAQSFQTGDSLRTSGCSLKCRFLLQGSNTSNRVPGIPPEALVGPMEGQGSSLRNSFFFLEPGLLASV